MVWGSTPQLSAIFMKKKEVSIHKFKTNTFVAVGHKITPEDLIIISEEFALLFYEQGFREVTVASWLQEDKVWVKIEA
jgi:hypothetical protein